MNRWKRLSPLLVGLLWLVTQAAARAEESRSKKDISYSQAGENRNQTSLDVYAPASGTDLPVMIWIHGGGWAIGDKRRIEEKPRVFNEQGFVFVSINYRLQPNTDYQGQVTDVAQAIHWVQQHAAEFGGSPEKLYLMGHSAGAHLAALVATDQQYLEAAGMKLSQLKGVVLLDGAGYDIPRQIELAPLPLLKQMYLTAFTKDEATQKAASPITHVAKDKGIPPFLILYVSTRRDGKLQSQAFGEALSKAGVSTQVIAAENKTHATINREIGLAGDLPTKQIFEFLQPAPVETKQE